MNTVPWSELTLDTYLYVHKKAGDGRWEQIDILMLECLEKHGLIIRCTHGVRFKEFWAYVSDRTFKLINIYKDWSGQADLEFEVFLNKIGLPH